MSPGCTNCYAIRTAYRQEHAFKRPAYAGLTRKLPDGSINWTGKVNADPERLLQPFKWAAPRRIFVDSQSDLFHEDVPDAFIDQVFAVMALTPWHTYQLLTKRADRLHEYMTRPVQGPMAGRYTRDGEPGTDVDLRMTGVLCETFKLCPPDVLNRAAHWGEEHYPGCDGFMPFWPLPNVWLGVSVENQAAANERIPHLVAAPARVRFLSCEPLLGPVDLSNFIRPDVRGVSAVTGEPFHSRNSISWVIAGGESGPGYRPLNLDWVRSLRDQCAAADVAFLFKQVGGRTPKAGGRELDGRTWDEFPRGALAALPATEAEA